MSENYETHKITPNALRFLVIAAALRCAGDFPNLLYLFTVESSFFRFFRREADLHISHSKSPENNRVEYDTISKIRLLS